MIALEVTPNANCEPVDLRVFEDLAPPRRVTQVRLERVTGQPRWHAVVGWSTKGQPCDAVAQKVSDSGDGVVWLIYGLGDAGLRLQPEGLRASWRLDDAQQWGVPLLLLAEEADWRDASTHEAAPVVTLRSESV